LLNEDCDLQICDFGLARAQISNDDDIQKQGASAILTDYITTRWYRAPEVMVSWKEYSTAIDVWAAGCIFAEMLLGKPIFPGYDEVEQVEMIIKMLGKEAQEQLEAMLNSDKLDIVENIHDHSKIQTLDQLFAKHNPVAVDLLKKMLVVDPTKRITIA